MQKFLKEPIYTYSILWRDKSRYQYCRWYCLWWSSISLKFTKVQRLSLCIHQLDPGYVKSLKTVFTKMKLFNTKTRINSVQWSFNAPINNSQPTTFYSKTICVPGLIFSKTNVESNNFKVIFFLITFSKVFF